MSALDIRPHSRRLSRSAVLALALLAGGSFTLGLVRQLAPPAPSPFSAPQGLSAAAQVPEATPAPSLQVATSEPPRRRAAEAAPETPPPEAAAPELLPVPAAASADAAPATDTAATSPDQAPPPAPAPPEEPPA